MFVDDEYKPWILQFLRSKIGRKQIESLATGNQESMRNIGQERIRTISVPVPPTHERARIVEKLDELFSDLEAGVGLLRRAKVKLKRHRASLLKAAVEGRITAEWRQANPVTEAGSELLARLLRERRLRWERAQLAKFEVSGKPPRAGWRERYVEPKAPDTSNLPDLPEGWCWATLGQCFRVNVGATPSRAQSSYWNGDIPWVSSGEVRFNEIRLTRERITELGLRNSSTQLNPAGSVLLGMIGEGKTRGQAAILRIPACNNQNCAAIWVSETDVVPEFVYAWLYSQYEVTRRAGSGNNQPALNKSLVEEMCFPLAPMREQLRIAELLDGSINSAQRVEDELSRGLSRTAALRQSILKHAFAGKLVPQDPSAEPAALLLERIRATRAAAPTARRARGRKEKAGEAAGAATVAKRRRRSK